MPALWIAHIKVTDPEAHSRYAELAGPAIQQHGGIFLARGGRYVQLEGEEKPRNVVVMFENIETAVACYNSTEYQTALQHAEGASERDLVVIEIVD